MRRDINSRADVPELIALGETMVMLAPLAAAPLGNADVLRLDIGGAESNVAMHVAAFGVSSAWVGAVGDDVLGARVIREVTSVGVDVGAVIVDREAPTGVYFKDPGRGVRYYRGGSAASRMDPASVASVPFESAAVVHLTGITPALSDSCAALVEAVVDRVQASSALLSFDVNHRAPLWAAARATGPLRALASRADLVFVGLDEAQGVWGTESSEAVRRLLPQPRRVVVKDGAIGATEFERQPDGTDAVVFVPAIPTEVVEATGAGDAFAGGYLAALLRGGDAEARLTQGHRRAREALLLMGDVGGEVAAGGYDA